MYGNIIFSPQNELKKTYDSIDVHRVDVHRLKQPKPSTLIFIEDEETESGDESPIDLREKRPKASTLTEVEPEGFDVSNEPSEEPSEEPTEEPTLLPSATPTLPPTHSPTVIPTAIPSIVPTTAPSFTSTIIPTAPPSTNVQPSAVPSQAPTPLPSTNPSFIPTPTPTLLATAEPTLKPFTFRPSLQPIAPGETAFPTVAATEAVTEQVKVNAIYQVESVRADFLNPTSTSTLQSTIEAVAPQPSTVVLKSYQLISSSVKSNAWQRSPSFSSAVSFAKVLGGGLRGAWSGWSWSEAGTVASALHHRDNMKLAALVVYKFSVESDIIFNLVDFPSDNATSLALRQTTVLEQTVLEGTFTSALRLLAVANNATQLLDAMVTNVTTQATIIPPSSSSSHHRRRAVLTDWQIVLIIFGTFFGFFVLFYYLDRCNKARRAAGTGKKYQSSESSWTSKLFPKVSSHSSSVVPVSSYNMMENHHEHGSSNLLKVTHKGVPKGHNSDNGLVMSEERYRELQL